MKHRKEESYEEEYISYTWYIDFEINDTITFLLSENRLVDKLSYVYGPEELKIRKEKKEKRNIELIYIKEKYQKESIKSNLLKTTKITECRQMEVAPINSVGEVDTRQIVIA